MGFLEGIFGKEQKYPPLESSSPAARFIEERKEEVESLVGSVKDRLELVPVHDAVYVFVGKPPKAFGMAWVKEGKTHNFKTLMEEKNLPPQKIQALSDKLRDAYLKHRQEERYSTSIAGQQVTVTPSEALARDVGELIHQV